MRWYGGWLAALAQESTLIRCPGPRVVTHTPPLWMVAIARRNTLKCAIIKGLGGLVACLHAPFSTRTTLLLRLTSGLRMCDILVLDRSSLGYRLRDNDYYTCALHLAV